MFQFHLSCYTSHRLFFVTTFLIFLGAVSNTAALPGPRVASPIATPVVSAAYRLPLPTKNEKDSTNPKNVSTASNYFPIDGTPYYMKIEVGTSFVAFPGDDVRHAILGLRARVRQHIPQSGLFRTSYNIINNPVELTVKTGLSPRDQGLTFAHVASSMDALLGAFEGSAFVSPFKYFVTWDSPWNVMAWGEVRTLRNTAPGKVLGTGPGRKPYDQVSTS
ncbi:MAG: hypothetical protein Q9164_000918 [Protoblastenia rupestris]